MDKGMTLIMINKKEDQRKEIRKILIVLYE